MAGNLADVDPRPVAEPLLEWTRSAASEHWPLTGSPDGDTVAASLAVDGPAALTLPCRYPSFPRGTPPRLGHGLAPSNLRTVVATMQRAVAMSAGP